MILCSLFLFWLTCYYINKSNKDWVVTHDSDEYITFNDRGFIQTGMIRAIQELKAENDLLKTELCAKDNSYSWC